MINTDYGLFNPDKWEKFCHRCLNIRYREHGYQKIPSTYRGDLGIESYTRKGLVFQCYCPEEDYRKDKMYEKNRDKITRDLKKLITYETQIIELLNGIKIRKWIFLTPKYRNRKILNHCNNKATKYRKYNKKHFHNKFDVLIYDIHYFSEEIPKIIGYSDKINIRTGDVFEKEIKKLQSESKKVDNISKKLKSTFPKPYTKKVRENISKMVNNRVIEYLKGEKILHRLEDSFQTLHEKFVRIIDLYETEVEERCFYPSHNNKELFDEIKNDLESVLNKEFEEILEYSVIQDLKKQVISDWLMRCPINFIGENQDEG